MAFLGVSCTMLIPVLHLVLLATVGAHRTTFQGYHILQIQVDTREQWSFLNNYIMGSNLDNEVWHWPETLGDHLHIMLNPSEINLWDNLCMEHKLNCTTLIKDVESLVNLELTTSENNAANIKDHHRHPRDVGQDDLLNRLSGQYPKFEEIEKWLLELNATERIINVSIIGQTYEGRNLYLTQITASDDPQSKPAIWADTGIHAREWIAYSSGIYIITQLIEGYYQSTTIRPLVENLVWYIMPVVNPDGYVYTHNEYRFWRKNRSPPPPDSRDVNKSVCFGVDLNRNWGYHWGEVGVNLNHCSYVYPGPHAESELETKAIRTFISGHSEQIHGYLNIHSYGQLFMSRYAYTNVTPPDHPQLLSVAKQVATAISKVHDVEYVPGISPEKLYAYAGGIADWAKGVAGIKYCYTVELRDKGIYGFALPANYVIPVGEEMFAGLRKLGTIVLERANNLTSEADTEMTTTSISSLFSGTTSLDSNMLSTTDYTNGVVTSPTKPMTNATDSILSTSSSSPTFTSSSIKNTDNENISKQSSATHGLSVTDTSSINLLHSQESSATSTQNEDHSTTCTVGIAQRTRGTTPKTNMIFSINSGTHCFVFNTPYLVYFQIMIFILAYLYS